MRLITTAIRLLLYIVILSRVYEETGTWTTAMLALCALGNELQALLWARYFGQQRRNTKPCN